MDKEVQSNNFSLQILKQLFCLGTPNNIMCHFGLPHITGDVMVDVIDEVAPDLSEFISSKTSNAVQTGGGRLCENVTLSLDYKLYWDENGITSVIVTRTVGTISILNNGWYLWHFPIICIIIIILTVLHCSVSWTVVLTARYSAAFLNGQVTSEPNSGNPGEMCLGCFWLF